MKQEDIKVGMRVRISTNPEHGRYGHGQQGRELTVLEVNVDSTIVKVNGLVPNEHGSTVGYIHKEHLVPLAFTKKDLKCGMRVQYRDGTIRVVGKSRLLGDDASYGMSLNVYDKNMLAKNNTKASEVDIVRVWAAPEQCEDFFNFSAMGVILFERVEKSAEQLKKEKLSDKMDDIRKQLEELQKEYNSL